jgi:phage baseplate assembly protein W
MADEFLGRGWAFPVTTDDSGGVAMAEGAADVDQAVRLILETEPGERVMRPDFGCGLRDLVFAPLNVGTRTIVRQRVEQGLTRWEPRIDVVDVQVLTDDAHAGRLLVHIDYRIRSSNTFYNLVYPLYLSEGRE